MEPQLHIQLFGDFCLETPTSRVSARDNRARKVWQLLAYLVCHRDRSISQKELIGLLWGEDSASSNPENALKITFHRARSLLDALWDNAGHELVRRQEGGYAWNRTVPMTLDAETFDRLCQTCRQSGEPEERLAAGLEAITLYRGEFLEKLSSESWVIPIATHYQNLYIETALEVSGLLAREGRHGEIAALCRQALGAEPYHEGLCQRLMTALAEQGDRKGAEAAYQSLRQRLWDDFGILPSDETTAVYRAVSQNTSGHSLPMDVVLDHLHEEEAAAGALCCEYDYFKVLCHVEARSMLRSGKTTHVALLSVHGHDLPKRSLTRAMDNLGERIRQNLRRGDVFSRCSANQYILLLLAADYEDSCMVCRRVVASFARRYPRSPVHLHFIVQPLSPKIHIP